MNPMTNDSSPIELRGFAMNIADTYTLSVSLLGIEIIALKKLTLVSFALAEKLPGAAGSEQRALAKTLHDLVIQIEIKAEGRQP